MHDVTIDQEAGNDSLDNEKLSHLTMQLIIRFVCRE
jgi:hypothetical protein